MRSKPYIFYARGRWWVQWHRPIDGDMGRCRADSFNRACWFAASLVRQYGLATS